MPKQSIDEQIHARIDVFVKELSALVREAAVEAVADALQEGRAASPKRRKAAPTKAAKRKTTRGKASTRRAPKKRVRRSADDLAKLGERVLAYVKAHPGARMEAIAKSLRKETKDLRRSVQDLIASKKLSTKGQKRATAYYAGASRSVAKKKGPTRIGAKKKTTRSKAKAA